MSTHYISSIFPQNHFDYAMSLCGLVGAYTLSSIILPITSPVTAIIYGLGANLSTRIFLEISAKFLDNPPDPAMKIAIFISAFFAGSWIAACFTNVIGLPISFTVGMFLHAAALLTLTVVNCLALSCLLCIGAIIGVRLLRDPNAPIIPNLV